MTHLVSPTAFRLNKSSLWKSNSIAKINVNNSPSNLIISASTFNGISLLLKHKLKRIRYLVIKTTYTHNKHKQLLQLRSIVMPRIKTKPISDGRGIFTRNVLYKVFNLSNTSIIFNTAKRYIKERRLKLFKFSVSKAKRINKWLSRRMLRGSTFSLYRFGFNNHRFRSFKRHSRKTIWLFKRNRRWYNSRARNFEKICCNKISHSISNILNQSCSLKITNIFSYLAYKQMIGYRSHQEHLWNKRYRKFRWSYDNYYDIVNSFFIISLIKNTEVLLLDMLRLVMPRIRKIKKFMIFLDTILKYMPQVRNSFFCFRILLTGKIRGGTERTKSLIVGFGQLPYQSISIEGSSSFISYPHKYGEFGIKLFLDRV